MLNPTPKASEVGHKEKRISSKFLGDVEAGDYILKAIGLHLQRWVLEKSKVQIFNLNFILFIYIISYIYYYICVYMHTYSHINTTCIYNSICIHTL